METQPVDHIHLEAENVALPAWSAPIVTRIELKRTLLGSGQVNDADGFTPGSG